MPIYACRCGNRPGSRIVSSPVVVPRDLCEQLGSKLDVPLGLVNPWARLGRYTYSRRLARQHLSTYGGTESRETASSSKSLAPGTTCMDRTRGLLRRRLYLSKAYSAVVVPVHF